MSKQLLAAMFVSALASLAPSAAHAFDTVTTFDPALGEVPESVTIDHSGNLYISVGNTIRKRTSAGEISVFATLPVTGVFALGVKVGPDGCVYNVSTSLSSTPGAFVWRTCSAGTTTQLAALDPSGGPNDLAFDDQGNLFVTDPFLGQIWEVDPTGAAHIWLRAPLLMGNPAAPALLFHSLGVDGIAFDRHDRNLYVSNVDYGRIVRIAVGSHGEAGCASVFAESPLLVGADGIAFDGPGTLLVAVNSQDRLVAVDRSGTVTSLAQGGLLDGPSSIVFDASDDEGHRKFYLTSSAFSRVFGLKPGPGYPALLSRDWQHRGLPLP